MEDLYGVSGGRGTLVGVVTVDVLSRKKVKKYDW